MTSVERDLFFEALLKMKAVFWFTTSSKRVDGSIGRSPGLAPLRTRSRYSAGRPFRLLGSTPYENKPRVVTK